MKALKTLILWFSYFLITACQPEVKSNALARNKQNTPPTSFVNLKPNKSTATVISENQERIFNDSDFVLLKSISKKFEYDMKYATADNFVKQKLYDCDNCMLRKNVAAALVKANKEFQIKGYRIKLFDCYRPLSVQKKMWKIMPDPHYIANPYTKGSYHNRGCAVDITLVDANTAELDMGTPFDHFSPKAHITCDSLPANVIANRMYLRRVMENNGFKGIRTEWWHFSYGQHPISDFDMCGHHEIEK